MTVNRDLDNRNVTYTFDEQCEITWGREYGNCPAAASTHNNAQCSQLWCNPLNNPELCKTKNQPPLEGTECLSMPIGMPGKCFAGRCLADQPYTSQDGQWGQWAREWDSCSVVCGTGTRLRRRTCLGRNGGKTCEGLDYQFHICNTQRCQTPVDRRTQACQKRTGNNKMVPFMATDRNVCHLSCREYDNSQVVWETKNLNNNDLHVPDGTFCKYDEPHGPICIQGVCKSADCENNDKSTAVKRADKCGVCDGDGSMCDHITNKKSKK